MSGKDRDLAMVVMKFGGSSVRDVEAVRRVIGIVGREKEARLVVVSALGGVTDGLLDIADLVEGGKGEEAREAVRALRRRHEDMAALVGSAEEKAVLLADLDGRFDELEAIVHALSVVEEISPRSRDTIVSFGEITSSRIVAAALSDSGIPSRSIDPRIVLVTDSQHGAAQPDVEATDERLRREVAPLLKEGVVPVLGGFIGANPAGLTTTLGRGGSDFSAALFGAGLGAEEIQIWTDVDGMLTADPRMIPATRVVPQLSFSEASELAYFGARVLHPSTILPAVRRDIPVRILNSHRPEAPGTRITRDPANGKKGPAAIACKRGLTRLDVTSTRMLMAYGFLRRVFEVFERYRTPVDVVTTSEVSVSVTIDDRRAHDSIVADLSEFAEVVSEHGMAIVCAVGDGLRRDPRLAAQMLGALEGLPLVMVSQGGSRQNITVVVREDAAAVAMERLHRHFFEDDDASAGTASAATA
ncbi:MAG: lysine-sensitive aspartokinase 3 [Acidobacteria bacterium]|nr:lysine-sensitive aspartokinase 3 [Acidobacteriota bacterium]